MTTHLMGILVLGERWRDGEMERQRAGEVRPAGGAHATKTHCAISPEVRRDRVSANKKLNYGVCLIESLLNRDPGVRL